VQVLAPPGVELLERDPLGPLQEPHHLEHSVLRS
jgi:hypothetical protein